MDAWRPTHVEDKDTIKWLWKCIKLFTLLWYIMIHGQQNVKLLSFFSLSASDHCQPTHCRRRGLLLHLKTRSDKPHSVGLLWIGINPSQRPLPDNRQPSRQTFKPPVGLGNAIRRSKWPQPFALERAATGISQLQADYVFLARINQRLTRHRNLTKTGSLERCLLRMTYRTRSECHQAVVA
jgi:hypothetical protein